MIKEALEYLIELGNREIFYEAGQTYSSQKLHLLQDPTANAIQVRSLSGLVEYLQSNFDAIQKSMVHIKSPTEVVCFTELNSNFNRSELIEATAMIPFFRFDEFYNTENFNIKMQSCFVKNEDRDIILKVVGNIQEEAVKTFGDDGISQSVVAKTGVASVGNVAVPNPVQLKPYRTFVEVEQPESEFIFRMQSGPKCALFEADGGAWKLEAMKNIKLFLEEKLKEKIDSGNIVIIA